MVGRAVLPVTADMVRAAAEALAGHVVDTPCAASPALSELTGANVYVKLETFQRTGSFKDRGARNRLLALTEQERVSGVVAASAGNHAQGVAYHARSLGVPATIVVPERTPFTKIARTRELGASVVVRGADVAAATAVAIELAAVDDLVFVHPYDDPLVIAGQGTVGLEIMAAVPDVDVIVAPVGGGGLLGGIAVAVRDAPTDGGHPSGTGAAVELVGVQADDFPAMAQRFHGVRGARSPGASTIADGIAVTAPGALTGELVRALVDDVVTVSEARIEESITYLLELEKTVTEGAGAAPLAALLDDPARFAGRTVVLVVSGGNIEPRVLASVILRGLGRQGRLVRILVDIDDTPGRLAEIAAVIAGAGANVVEVEHGRLTSDIAVQRARVSFVLETVDAAHAGLVFDALGAAGFPAERREL
ncbi:MAG TPA: threonine ammonia-lyase [Acidimicrobiia bacterium]|nr:threonine ammonia-lyase [Acidimicrobiia bacterium]